MSIEMKNHSQRDGFGTVLAGHLHRRGIDFMLLVHGLDPQRPIGPLDRKDVLIHRTGSAGSSAKAELTDVKVEDDLLRLGDGRTESLLSVAVTGEFKVFPSAAKSLDEQRLGR